MNKQRPKKLYQWFDDWSIGCGWGCSGDNCVDRKECCNAQDKILNILVDMEKKST